MAKPGRRSPSSFLFTAVALASCFSTSICHDITSILDRFPDYSLQNTFMSSTKIADEVNSRQSITCLVLHNSAMSAIASHHSPSSLKTALRLLVLLDYYDTQKLHDISAGSALTTTLFQTTGEAIGQQGFVNITDMRGGRVLFRSAVSGSDLSSDYTKSVLQIPYNISVLEISAPIIFPGLFDGSAIVSDVNLTAVLEKAGCRIFASLVSSSGMIKVLQLAMGKGLTLFAPIDEAFRRKEVPDLGSLSSADLVTLIQYHAVAAYNTKESLKTDLHPISTMASGAAGNYEIAISVQGDEVTLRTGVDSSRIARTVLDEMPACVMTVESVLLPQEIFGKAPVPALAPVKGSPSVGKAPSAVSPAAKSPMAQSPEARSPAAESPAAESPAAESPAAESPAAESPAAESPAAESPAAESPDDVADNENKSMAVVAGMGYLFAAAAVAAFVWVL